MAPSSSAPGLSATMPCPIVVITMRPEFWKRLHRQLAGWIGQVRVCEATDGRTIDVAGWIAGRRYQPGEAPSGMTRGELGCSDSHQRVWRHVVQSGAEGALVLEDDADVPPDLPLWVQAAWRYRDRWDLAYLGYNWQPNARPVPDVAGFEIPDLAGAWHVMHAYLLTQRGAKRLLQDALPIRLPLDVYVARCTQAGLRAWQSVRPVVPTIADTWSSTQGIR